MQGKVLSNISAEPQRVRERDVASVRVVAGVPRLVSQLQCAVTAVVIYVLNYIFLFFEREVSRDPQH